MKKFLWKESSKYRTIVLLVAGMMAVFLSACNTESDVKGDSMAVSIESFEQTDSDFAPDAVSSGKTSVPEDNADDYREVYRQAVEAKEGEGFSFSLVYLDEDDIPELAVCDRGYGTYSIYTVKDGELFCMMDAMAIVEMSYFERRGFAAQFARWNGGGDEGGYGWYYYQVSRDKTLADGDVPVLHFSYDAVYDEEGNWTGGGVTKYYHMDQEVDEAAYQKLMDDFGIAEGCEKSFAENSFGKQELLEQLEAGTLQSGIESEEEMMADLTERMKYYQKSVYYAEMTDYWENVREVRDVSYRMEPLYESNQFCLTREMLADDPPVVIHLAKNEIYARHGYIFKDPDLYNYFMGCTWYTPSIKPENFDDGVFNEYEKENLKLLGELDTL